MTTSTNSLPSMKSPCWSPKSPGAATANQNPKSKPDNIAAANTTMTGRSSDIDDLLAHTLMKLKSTGGGSGARAIDAATLSTLTASSSASSPEKSATASWLKKRLLVETLAANLPSPEHDELSCDGYLRLLRAGGMVGAGSAAMRALEVRAARKLEQASLAELMVPAFGHTCGSLLDVGLVRRLVKGFVAHVSEDGSAGGGGAVGKTVKVARLVDAYLAEAALEGELDVREFADLVRALPSHARACDDGLYRAVDTYLKVHPATSKEDRKGLCRLIDVRKLSSEAAAHAVQNERLPVRSIMQVIFSEHAKLIRIADWSGSFSGTRSPSPALDSLSGRCPSKRTDSMAQQQELRRLREEVARLHVQCSALQTQVERFSNNSDKKRRLGFFRWSSFLFGASDHVSKVVEDSENGGMERRTPSKTSRTLQRTATPTKWRKSTS